jgi:uncharacterized oxidoreductase
MKIRVCDLAKETERVSLFEWVTSEFPSLNVLVNKAGIQRRLQLSQTEEREETRQEMATKKVISGQATKNVDRSYV